MAIGHQSFYQTALTSGISASDLIIPLDTVPTVSEGFLVIESTVQAKREIIYFTSKDATTVTCPSGAGNGRGYDGTTAVAHLQGATVIMAPVGVMFEKLGDISVNSITINNTTSAEGWSPLGDTPDTVTANGNKSYDLVFNSNDLTDTITPGMRLRTARTVAAPIQSTSLNGTTQYYSKSSPNKMTFTDDFSVSAWVKMSSYGALGVIASRYNGTSGWRLLIDSDGTVYLTGYNAGSANFSYVKTYQSVPLNKWVHISAQLDMSAFTATTTTSYVMIDGVDVPALVSRGGTNPTALVQAGNLEIGSANATSFFPGKIAQVAIYSAKVTQATHLAAMNQGLSGSETSLISAYSFSNSITDLNTTTPNDLTANGSAVATNADSPFGNSGVSTTLDYGIVMAASFSTNTTLTVQVPEGCTIPSSGGVSTVDYSTQSVPYGFPRGAGKWTISSLYRHSLSQNTPTVNVWYNLGSAQLKVPSGSWKLRYSASGFTGNGSNPPSMHSTLHTANNAEDIYMTVRAAYISIVGNIMGNFYREGFYNPTASTPTPYYLNAKTDQTSTTHITFGPSAEATIIEAENAYI